jgi:redox-sensitive bicupin YhaK (pirin superfamily)
MSGFRTIKKVITGRDAVDGAGVKLVRVFGNFDVKDFDPFLMLDAFDSDNPEDYTKGFPWHPHRGIETITYLIQGDIEHGDSLGNKGSIMEGDCQWMTAGSGIIHQEMPKACPHMLGVQLWLNLPASDKMTPPKYRDIKRKTIPAIKDGDAMVHIIAGKYKGIVGAVEGDHVKPDYFDVELKPGAEWCLETDPDSNLFIYILKGAGTFSPEQEEAVAEKHAVLFDSGKWFWVKAETEGIRFLLLAGKPLREPVAWGGPIVMNTNEELELAFQELNNNTFIK